MAKINDPMATRRDVISKVFKGAGFVALGGLTWSSLMGKAKSTTPVLRPPGAIDEPDFLKKCIKCGLCVEACPYETLKLVDLGEDGMIGTPRFVAREIPCYMCTDIPCVPPCPTGALDLKSVLTADGKEMDINKSRMGLAVLNKESCVAFFGIQCDACYRACPLLEDAIRIVTTRNERTGKHAYLIPEVNADTCTGCGLCEHACITEVPAIKVFPRSMVMGKDGSHYVKGWDAKDEAAKMKMQESEESSEQGSSTLDYLNDNGDLFNDD